MTAELATQMLKRVWTEYHKPMAAMHLASRIDLSAVRRAASVETALAAFLDQIGLLGI